jgi:hypothetical protein
MEKGTEAISRRMKSTLWIQAAAGYDVALALFHVMFWRIFRWKEELPKLHRVNRGVMQMLNLMLIVALLTAGILLLAWPADATSTPFGRAWLGGWTLFWFVRAVLQPVVFRDSDAKINAAFTSLFFAGAMLHGLALTAGGVP